MLAFVLDCLHGLLDLAQPADLFKIPCTTQRGINRPRHSASPRFGTGAGGSLVIADVDRRMTVAYVMNKMVPVPVVGPIAAALVERVYDIVNR
jgi:hypothetical protein